MNKMTNDTFVSELTKASWMNECDQLVNAPMLYNFTSNVISMMLDENFDVSAFSKVSNADSLARNCLTNAFFFALGMRNYRNQLTPGETLLVNSSVSEDIKFFTDFDSDNFAFSTPVFDKETLETVVNSGILEMEYSSTNFSSMIAAYIAYCLSYDEAIAIMKVLWECLPRDRWTITDYVIGHLTYTETKEEKVV